MPFETDKVKYLAHLARIDIDDTRDGQSIQENLNRIITMVDQITTANTEGIEPMAHPLDAQQHLRLDEITESNQRDAFLNLASKTAAGLYLVPLMIEEA